MIYIHVPFCRSFCTYCDFYSEIACRGRDLKLFEDYAECLLAEVQHRKDEMVASRSVNTLYIGGGTPSVLPADILEKIVISLPLKEFDEFTLEVNPEDIVDKGREYLNSLTGIGVNRISMGVQSLDDGILRWMNRRHDAAKARQAYLMLREAGLTNVSVDVIYGVSGMSRQKLEATVREIALDWHPQHISAYQLSVEDGSALASTDYSELDDESCRKHYELVCTLLREAGYRHYEISNWAIPGHEARHNSAYWKRVPYVGLGPGAHSLDLRGGQQVRSWNSEGLLGWTPEKEVLTDDEIREERLMLGLRTAEGVDGKVIREEDWFIADSIIRNLF